MLSFIGRLSKGDLDASELREGAVEARYRSKPVPTVIGHAVVGGDTFLQVRVPPEALRELDSAGGEIHVQLLADESIREETGG